MKKPEGPYNGILFQVSFVLAGLAIPIILAIGFAGGFGTCCSH